MKKFVLIVGSLLLFSGIITGGVLAFLKTKTNREREKIKIENINSEDAKKLITHLTYTGNEGTTDYYSPSLDILLTYDDSKYSVYELPKGVGISPRDNPNMSFSFLINSFKKSEYADAKAYFKYRFDYNKAYTVVENSDPIEKFSVVEFQFEKVSFLQESNSKIVYNKALIKDFDDTSIVFLLSVEEEKQLIEKYLPNAIEIFKSVKFKPENIDNEISYKVKDIGLSVKIDRKKWDKKALSDTYLGIQFRSSDFEEKEENKYDVVAINIYSYPIFSNEKADENYFKSKIADDISYIQDSYKDKKIQIDENIEKIVIGSLNFYNYSYKYELFDKPLNFSVYYGFNEEKKSGIKISFSYNSVESNGYKEAQKVISNIKFNETDTASSKVIAQDTKTTTLEIDKATFIGKPAVVHIFNKTCTDFIISNIIDLPNTSGKKFTMCMAGSGTGFFVNKDGYIVTNAHVAAPNLKDIVASAGSISKEYITNGHTTNPFDKDKLILSLTSDILKIYKTKDPSIDTTSSYVLKKALDDAEETLLTLLLDEKYSANVKISNPIFSNYVQKNLPFEFDEKTIDLKNKTEIYETQVIGYKKIDSSYQVMYNVKILKKEDGIKVPDIAIIKITNSNGSEFPSVKIADFNEIVTGQKIWAIGFPGRAEDQKLFSSLATTIPTITSGTISGIKPSFNNSYKIIQFDASVGHGNSGGPVINSEGNVVGIVTYELGAGQGDDKAADFNAAMSAQEISNFLSEQGISNDIGEVTKNINEAFSNISKGYFKRAVENLEKTKNIYSGLDDLINPLIAILNKKIANNEDKSPIIEVKKISLSKDELKIAGIACGAVAIGALILIISSLFSRPKKIKIEQQQLPQNTFVQPQFSNQPNYFNQTPNQFQNQQQNFYNQIPQMPTQFNQGFNQTNLNQDLSQFNQQLTNNNILNQQDPYQGQMPTNQNIGSNLQNTGISNHYLDQTNQQNPNPVQSNDNQLYQGPQNPYGPYIGNN